MFNPRHVQKVWNSPTLTTWANFGINLASSAILLPYVLRVFSPQEIAFYLTILTIVGLQSLMTLGFSPTFIRFFSYSRGGLPLEQLVELKNQPFESISSSEINWPTVAAIAQTGKRLFLMLAALCVVLLLTLGSVCIQHIVADMPNPTSGWIAWIVVCLSMAISTVCALYDAYLHGLGHLAKSARCSAIMGAGAFICCLLVLIFSGSLLLLIVVRQLWQIFERLGFYFLARRIEHARWREFSGPSQPAIIKVAWQSAWRSAIGVAGSSGLNSGLAIFYSTVASSAKLASFLLAFRLLNVISNLSLAPFYSHLPELQRAYALGCNQAFVRDASKRIVLALWAFVLPVSALYFLADQALGLIGSQTHLPSALVVVALSWACFAERYTGAAIQLYTITNHVVWHWFAFAYIATIGVIIYPLFNNLGALGIALAFLIARVISSIPLSFILLKRMLKDHIWMLHKPLIGPFVFMVFSSAIYLQFFKAN